VIQTERYGDVTRFEMASAVSRLVGYSASAFLVRGALVDCGFHAVAAEFMSLVERVRPDGVLLTHYHEDHAGNAEIVARSGIPLSASAATLAQLRDPAPIRLYRRLTWGVTPPLRSSPATFAPDGLSLIPAPGHSRDHHVVWDPTTGTLFGGDLYLGVKVRVAHPGEDPYQLSRTLRDVAALGATRLFDAHRGFVDSPTPLLLSKADWIDETIRGIEQRIAAGVGDASIVRELFGGESLPGYLSGGDYSRTNFVRAVRRRAAG
jgi:glyoxylase-like metal-dependent hydrolase (beta-lactamase superfamily II)